MPTRDHPQRDPTLENPVLSPYETALLLSAFGVLGLAIVAFLTI